MFSNLIKCKGWQPVPTYIGNSDIECLYVINGMEWNGYINLLVKMFSRLVWIIKNYYYNSSKAKVYLEKKIGFEINEVK